MKRPEAAAKKNPDQEREATRNLPHQGVAMLEESRNYPVANPVR